MDVVRFEHLLRDAAVGKNDVTWFPRWLKSYSASLGKGSQTSPVDLSKSAAADIMKAETGGPLSVTEERVIVFLQGLRDSGTPAWQRLQAVRAVEAYRNLVLQTDVPSLDFIRQQGKKVGQIPPIEEKCWDGPRVHF